MEHQYATWQIVLGFWLRWVPSEAFMRTKKFLRDTQTLGWAACVLVIAGSAIYWLWVGRDRAQDQWAETLAFGVAAPVVLIVLYFAWQCLCVPAEMYSSCIKRDTLSAMCRDLIEMHRTGSEILDRLRQSDGDAQSASIEARDAWVIAVRNYLSDKDGRPNAWTFKFDDATGGGVSLIQDASVGLGKWRGAPDEKFVIIQSMTTRLVALSEIISFIGNKAQSVSMIED